MPTLLRIDASISGTASRTRRITQAFTDAWSARGPEFAVVSRDLAADPIPHLPDAALHWPARMRPADAAPPAAAEALQAELIAELVAADVLLLGAPMYNYSLPSTLKAWIDHVHVPGVTADFDEPAHPLAGRPAIIATACGASYEPGGPTDGWDHTVPPLELVLGTAFRMQVEVVATELTLADTIPAMAGMREAAAEQLEAAVERARALAAR
ncbi:FMN-dependent NADH-azoreductase [Agromyces archimandritae]|uniref:FMN dependent NADH:quinone oxidoreductase n=1 Tax=Agromyces archimandritae TaxID=2781962 RepID=A0A975IND3_9MICO|nr:NAD(P)H-dependent oxidoreductase [Agromyces archimandritae]QTX04129.1 NAD(P)H-dependent oxidoreductase [Agromyces archimandritae]